MGLVQPSHLIDSQSYQLYVANPNFMPQREKWHKFSTLCNIKEFTFSSLFFTKKEIILTRTLGSHIQTDHPERIQIIFETPKGYKLDKISVGSIIIVLPTWPCNGKVDPCHLFSIFVSFLLINKDHNRVAIFAKGWWIDIKSKRFTFLDGMRHFEF